MKRKVKIVSMPKAQSGLDFKINAGRSAIGLNANQLSWPVMAGEFSAPDLKVAKNIGPSKGPANIEAEKGETLFQIAGFGGLPAHFTIGGKKHYEGGTPLNVPADSFIFSDHSSMKIKDPSILKLFNKSEKKSGYTPADIAKQYDINKYLKILKDPDSDRLQRETAEMMISNYNLKLGKLALAQESIKGFPQGIPAVAMPYLITMNINPQDFTQMEGESEEPAPNMAKGGSYMPKAQRGFFNRGRTTMRYNPQSGVYEVLDRNGNVIGFGNPGSQYPSPGGYNPPTDGGMGLPSSTGKSNTGVAKAVKKQDIPKDAVVIKRSDYATEEEYIQARDNAYRNKGSKNVYTQGQDGKYYKVSEKAGGISLDQNIEMVRTTFSDPEVQKELYARTVAAAKDPKNKGRNMGFTLEELEKMTPEELALQFIEMQERNLKTAYLFQKEGVGYGCFDNATGKRKPGAECSEVPYASLDEAFEKAGAKPPADAKSKGLQQAAYIGYRDLLNDNSAGKIQNTAISEKLKPFEVAIQGNPDETGPDVSKAISKIDTAYTNTTSGQLAKVKSPSTIAEELVEEREQILKDPAKAAQYTAGDMTAPWWLQDIINISGKFSDWSKLKKYYPNMPVPEVVLPEGVYADPNRALAANAEQANIMAQNLAAFRGPQALSSRSSQIQGQAARQAADIMGRYDTMNVGIANQLESQRSQILNSANMTRADLKAKEDMYNAIVNQNFDNAEVAYKNQMRKAYMDAITNRWNTFNINQLNEQYKAHPEIGGGIFFTHGKPVEPDASSSTAMFDRFRETKHMLPGVDDSIIWQMTKADMGIGEDDSDTDSDYQTLMKLQSNMFNTPGQ